MIKRKAQKWAKKKEKSEVINKSGKNLTGPLRIEGFMNLKSISIKKHKITYLVISQCPQLTRIDLFELNVLTGLFVKDCPELSKLECHGQLGRLHLSNNNKLKEINCCKNRLTELDVSDCPSLIELNCSYNAIKYLILNLCPKITKLNCSNNQLFDLEISNCSKLESLDCSHNKLTSLYLRNRSTLESLDCSHNELTHLNISNCFKLEKALDYSHNTLDLNIFREEGNDDEIRNLLIIGPAGSTLSNTLYGYSKNPKKKEFEWNETKYRVVDTMEFGDTKLKVKQVMLKIAKVIHSMPEGISQVLFVIDRRFEREEIEMFELFKNLMLKSGILQYFTIVRTKFGNFKDYEECKNDKDQLCMESKTIALIADSCRDIIYVDDLSTNVNNDDDKESIPILLKYLEIARQEKPYKLKTWNDIHDESDIFKIIIEEIEIDPELIIDIPEYDNICDNSTREVHEELKHTKLDEMDNNTKTSIRDPQTWITNSIIAKLIKYMKWDELTDQSKIGSGHYGSVRKAHWSKTNDYVVCKKLNNIGNMWDELQHEIEMQIRAHACENIIRFIGVTQEPQNDDYCIVMQYAEGGDLRVYLEKNFSSFSWDKKYQLAFDITNGLHYLHKENILHRDLHAKNIVIHKGRAKITDFGNSKSIETQTKMHKEAFGIAPYVAPELLKHDSSLPPPFSMKSDIYSLGVLLWELSSGYPPFKNQSQISIGLILNILGGMREQKIPDTPSVYYDLYTACWNGNPEMRPIIEDIHDKLKNMLPKNNEPTIITEDKKVGFEDTGGSLGSSITLTDEYSKSIEFNFNKDSKV